MKNKMGIILMVSGGLFFVVGLFLYLSKKETTEEILINDATEVIKANELSDKQLVAEPERDTPQVEKVLPNKELEKAIEVAIADGVLSSNERKLIRKLTDEKGLDYDTIIKDAESQMAELSGDDPETELVDYNKKNGHDFEKYIVGKFDRRYFKIMEWAGDKYVDGNYAKTTTQPDILFEFKLKGNKEEFSVECKWRSKFYKNGVELGTAEQIKRYKDFEREKDIPVFIALGVGGKGKSPERVFFIPLKEIDANYISIERLEKFEKNNESMFFFDIHTKEISWKD